MSRDIVIMSILKICKLVEGMVGTSPWLWPRFEVDKIDETAAEFQFDPLKALGLRTLKASSSFMELCAIHEDERETFLQDKLASKGAESLAQYHREFLDLLPFSPQEIISYATGHWAVSPAMAKLMCKIAKPNFWSLQTTLLHQAHSTEAQWKAIIANYAATNDLENLDRHLETFAKIIDTAHTEIIARTKDTLKKFNDQLKLEDQSLPKMLAASDGAGFDDHGPYFSFRNACVEQVNVNSNLRILVAVYMEYATPDDFLTMFAHGDYAGFHIVCTRGINGAETLKFLVMACHAACKKKADADFNEACNKDVTNREFLQEKYDAQYKKEVGTVLRAMLFARDEKGEHAGLRAAAREGLWNCVGLLLALYQQYLPKILSEILVANNHAIFTQACAHGEDEIVALLLTLYASEDLRANLRTLLAANDFEIFRTACENKHEKTVQLLFGACRVEQDVHNEFFAMLKKKTSDFDWDIYDIINDETIKFSLARCAEPDLPNMLRAENHGLFQTAYRRVRVESLKLLIAAYEKCGDDHLAGALESAAVTLDDDKGLPHAALRRVFGFGRLDMDAVKLLLQAYRTAYKDKNKLAAALRAALRAGDKHGDHIIFRSIFRLGKITLESMTLVLDLYKEYAPDDLPNALKARDNLTAHAALNRLCYCMWKRDDGYTIEKHLTIIKLLLNQYPPKLLGEVLLADNYDIFKAACVNGSIKIIGLFVKKYLEHTSAAELGKALIANDKQDNPYGALRVAYDYKNLAAMKLLLLLYKIYSRVSFMDLTNALNDAHRSRFLGEEDSKIIRFFQALQATPENRDKFFNPAVGFAKTSLHLWQPAVKIDIDKTNNTAEKNAQYSIS